MQHQSKATSKRLDPSTGESIRAEQASPLRPQEAGRLCLVCPPSAGKSALALRMVARLAGIGAIGGGE